MVKRFHWTPYYILKELTNRPKNGINSYFRMYSSDPAILKASDQGNETGNRL